MIVDQCPLMGSHSFVVDEQVVGHKLDTGQETDGHLVEDLAGRRPDMDQATGGPQEVLAAHTPGMGQVIVDHQPAHFHSLSFHVARSFVVVVVVVVAHMPGKVLVSQLVVVERCHWADDRVEDLPKRSHLLGEHVEGWPKHSRCLDVRAEVDMSADWVIRCAVAGRQAGNHLPAVGDFGWIRGRHQQGYQLKRCLGLESSFALV